MKVILLKTIKSLGKEGEVIEVSDGHAQNFLFPQNAAIPATPDALKRIKEREMSLKSASKKAISATGKIAQALNGYEVVIQEKMNADEVLYAAVTKKMIAKAIKKAGFDVSEEMVELAEPLKHPGEHAITIALPNDFEAEIKLIVEGVS